MSRPQDPGSTGPRSTGPAGTGNGNEPGLAARVRERWGVHGRGQHERDRAEARSVDLHDGVRERAGRSGGGRPSGGRHGGARNAGGEQFVVPRARPDSYYGKPIIKEPVWGTRDVGGYLFLGGLAGASAVLAGFAQATGNHRQAKVSKVAAVGAVGLSGVALVADLGRPERFVNMLRVFKPTSPMSVGSWLLSGFGGAAVASAACAVTGRLPRAGAAATAGAAVLGPGVCTYTAALICDTAVPAWHEGHREMPYLFAGSAASAAGGLGMLATPGHAGLATRFAALGAVTELTAKRRMMDRLGGTGEPYRTGRPGKLLNVAEVLTVAGAAAALLGGGPVLGGGAPGGRRRVMNAICGAALLTASALTRFGIFEAGRASARDPKYTVRPQRERLAAKAADSVTDPPGS
jgi:formate-dependent nitrite reductase membrane component NrfD